MKRTFPSLAAVATGALAPTLFVAAAAAAPAHHAPAHHVSHPGRYAHNHHATTVVHKLTAVDERYLKLYHEVQTKFGTRAPGRDIVRYGLTASKPATVAAIEKSIGTLTGMLVAADPTASTATESTTTATTAAVQESAASAAPAASGLTACIIERESGGDPSAVNASGHMGEGQWDESTWLADGGGAYGATPLDASAAEQEQVIANQVAAGNTGQWTDYDGC